ncbi:hypothetical protein O6H91_01G079400 [Diphasiastrum complanatum]|uniref:Uncharacterized protein n=1 Tax=Diphasiastrum complanatum TaxID=34168 RepID=A0ACC2ESQ5_DIPCM|nr:hypothetical protein O6H91_01G079400 [Diphasiastrum complanatum]
MIRAGIFLLCEFLFLVSEQFLVECFWLNASSSPFSASTLTAIDRLRETYLCERTPSRDH